MPVSPAIGDEGDEDAIAELITLNLLAGLGGGETAIIDYTIFESTIVSCLSQSYLRASGRIYSSSKKCVVLDVVECRGKVASWLMDGCREQKNR